jgi:hypothetical protein
VPYVRCHRLTSASYCHIPPSVLGHCGTAAAFSRICACDNCACGVNPPLLLPYVEYPLHGAQAGLVLAATVSVAGPYDS